MLPEACAAGIATLLIISLTLFHALLNPYWLEKTGIIEYYMAHSALAAGHQVFERWHLWCSKLMQPMTESQLINRLLVGGY